MHFSRADKLKAGLTPYQSQYFASLASRWVEIPPTCWRPTLVACCSAYRGVTTAQASEHWPNLTIKKIPKMVGENAL